MSDREKEEKNVELKTFGSGFVSFRQQQTLG